MRRLVLAGVLAGAGGLALTAGLAGVSAAPESPLSHRPRIIP